MPPFSVNGVSDNWDVVLYTDLVQYIHDDELGLNYTNNVEFVGYIFEDNFSVAFIIYCDADTEHIAVTPRSLKYNTMQAITYCLTPGGCDNSTDDDNTTNGTDDDTCLTQGGCDNGTNNDNSTNETDESSNNTNGVNSTNSHTDDKEILSRGVIFAISFCSGGAIVAAIVITVLVVRKRRFMANLKRILNMKVEIKPIKGQIIIL